MSYFDELQKSMEWLGKQGDTIFIGQGLNYGGTFQSNTFKNVPLEKKIELGVIENSQLGMSIGLSKTGFKVISVFPRWNFLVCAADQLLNHCDFYNPNVIIRVGIGATKPIYAGFQHCGDFTSEFASMLKKVKAVKLDKIDNILKEYQQAYYRDGCTIIVEEMSRYNEE